MKLEPRGIELHDQRMALTVHRANIGAQTAGALRCPFPFHVCGIGVQPSLATGTTDVPISETTTRVRLEDVYQVILYNDDHNSMGHVTKCLMQVFGHSTVLAVKIMLEAHSRGRAIAEVETEPQARLHRDQLQSFGLTASIEKI